MEFRTLDCRILRYYILFIIIFEGCLGHDIASMRQAIEMRKMESNAASKKASTQSSAAAANESSPVQASWVNEEDVGDWDPFGSET